LLYASTRADGREDTQGEMLRNEAEKDVEAAYL
jgi:hypothetical protein